jgi:hypothetical protein
MSLRQIKKRQIKNLTICHCDNLKIRQYVTPTTWNSTYTQYIIGHFCIRQFR